MFAEWFINYSRSDGNNKASQFEAVFAMLTDRQQFIILDAINEPFRNLVLTSAQAFTGTSPLILTIVQLQASIAILPPVRVTMLGEIAVDLQAADLAIREEAISGKRRLIQADVLKWSDNPAMSQQLTIAQLKSDLAMKIRTILGLDSIAVLMQRYGLNTSTTTALYRS